MACGFKNFARVVHCALCGLSSADQKQVSTSAVRPIVEGRVDLRRCLAPTSGASGRAS